MGHVGPSYRWDRSQDGIRWGEGTDGSCGAIIYICRIGQRMPLDGGRVLMGHMVPSYR